MKFLKILAATVYTILATTIVVPPEFAIAQETAAQTPLVVKDKDKVGVSGVVTNLRPRTFTVRTGDSTVDVDMTANRNLNRILREGMEVYVEGRLGLGRFNDPVIRADEIRITGYIQPNPPIVVLPPGQEQLQ